MTLLADHDDALFACVSSILEAEGSELNRHDEVLQTVARVFRVTQRAISAFAERWNSRKAASLPVELLVQCFKHLRFDDRLLVSRVSQHWRRVALGTPLLWSTFSTWKQNGKLEEMLRRSQFAPLSLRLLLTSADETALHPHFARIRELGCHNPPEKLDAPLLETMVLEGVYSRDLALSQDYVGSSAQSLRKLHIRTFSISPTCPVFGNLLEFKGTFTIFTRLQDLLPLCPSLVSLTVLCLSHALALSPDPFFVPLPSRLSEVTITGLYVQTGPTCDALRPWLSHRFRRLQLSHLLDISGALHLFSPSIAAPKSPWSLEMRMDAQMSYILSTRTDQVHLVGPEFTPEDAGAAIASIQQFRPHIEHLTDLRLSIRLLRTALDMSLQLPAVTSLALVAAPEHDGRAQYTSFNTTGQMVIPMLRSLAFSCRPNYAFGRPALAWFFRSLAHQLRLWLQYDAAMLDVISLEGKVSKTALKKVDYKHSVIYSLALEIRIDPSAGVE